MYDRHDRALPVRGPKHAAKARRGYYLYLALAILAEVIATTFMKWSDGFTRLGPSLVTVTGYLIAFFFLSLTLKTIPTGIVYAIWSGVGIVLIALLAWALQGQKLDAGAVAGMPSADHLRRRGDERILEGERPLSVQSGGAKVTPHALRRAMTAVGINFYKVEVLTRTIVDGSISQQDEPYRRL